MDDHPYGSARPDGAGLLNLFDAAAAAVRPADDRALAEVADAVIDAINREFPASVLQTPSDAERTRIQERVGAFVAAEFRKRGGGPGFQLEAMLAADLGRRLMGLGFLDLLLPPARTDVSEIAVYSSGLVQVMKKGSVRWETVDLRPEPREIWRVLDRVLGPQNRTLNEANPSVNAKLPATPANPGGGRVKALHPAIAPPGRNPSINLRLFEQTPVRPDWLLERGVMSAEMMALLARAIAAGYRLLICGGTRTGKTTLLSALCAFLPEAWRIVKIEDPEEIWVDRPTVQAIEARPQAVGTEVRPYTLADGVDDALRLSPDYLIVGEVRDGRAAMSLFRAMMTGHAGACTFHADTPREAARRLATVMGADAGVRAGEAHQMIADAVDLLVQIGIRDEVRRVVTIANVGKQTRGGDVSFEPIFRFDPASPPGSPRWEPAGALAARTSAEDVP